MPWYEEDDFWDEMTPFLFPEQRWKVTPEEVTNIISLLGINPGETVLAFAADLEGIH